MFCYASEHSCCRHFPGGVERLKHLGAVQTGLCGKPAIGFYELTVDPRIRRRQQERDDTSERAAAVSRRNECPIR
jgi:hypothetical protein